MSDKNFILVQRYGWSGSREFDSCQEPGVEFRIVKDPYGIDDLYHNLVDRGGTFNSDMAIRDFLWCMDKTNRKETHFQVGLNWKFFFWLRFSEKMRAVYR
jgi:hypothetical protein